jgi:hypothetical protein
MDDLAAISSRAQFGEGLRRNLGKEGRPPLGAFSATTPQQKPPPTIWFHYLTDIP